MKRIALIPAIALGALFVNTANAQVGINVGFHLGGAHVAAQVVSAAPDQYYNDDDYYYLPDVGAYYDVNDQSYFYNDGYNWVSAAYLPGYNGYDVRNFRRYEVRANRPYLRDEYYRGRYDGRVGNWGRNDERMYADRGYRTNAPRYDDRRFDNRDRFNNGQVERFNTPREFEQFNNDRRFNNRENMGPGQTERFETPREFQQPQQNGGRENFDRGNGGRGMSGNGFNQSAQPNMNQRGNNEPQQNNGHDNFDRGNGGRGMGGNDHVQSAQPNMSQRGNNAPAQNGGENHGGQWNRGGGHAI